MSNVPPKSTADHDKGASAKRGENIIRHGRRSASKERKWSDASVSPSRNNQDYIGFPPAVPRAWIETRTVNIKRDAGKPLFIDVTRHLLVRGYADDAGEIEYADFVRAVNGRKVNTREELSAILDELKCPPAPHTAVLTVKRVRQKMEIRDEDMWKTIPPAAVHVRGFDHFHVGLALPPGARLGFDVRVLNSKIYVTKTYDDWNCIARRCLLAGDAILKVGDTAVTDNESLKSVVGKAFHDEKWTVLLVERAATPLAVKLVKQALLAGNPDPNPPIPRDVWEIARRQLAWMKAHPGEEPACSILKEDQPDAGPSAASSEHRATIAPMSQQMPIGMDPVDIKVLQEAPPLPSATGYAKHAKNADK